MDRTKIAFSSDRTIDDRRNILTDLLRHGICEVTFIKVNGETRTMPCTLNESIIPLAPVHKTNTNNPIDFPKKEKKYNPDNMSVWCTDKNEWRSFKLANVTEIASVNTQYENTMPRG